MALRTDWEDSVCSGEHVLSWSLSFLYSKIWCERDYGKGFTYNLPKTTACCSQLSPQFIDSHLISPNPSHPGPSAQVCELPPALGNQGHIVGCLCTLWGGSSQTPWAPAEWGKVNAWVYTSHDQQDSWQDMIVKSTDLGDRLFWLWISAGWFVGSVPRNSHVQLLRTTVPHIPNGRNRIYLTNLFWTLNMTLHIKAQYRAWL